MVYVESVFRPSLTRMVPDLRGRAHALSRDEVRVCPDVLRDVSPRCDWRSTRIPSVRTCKFGSLKRIRGHPVHWSVEKCPLTLDRFGVHRPSGRVGRQDTNIIVVCRFLGGQELPIRSFEVFARVGGGRVGDFGRFRMASGLRGVDSVDAVLVCCFCCF